MKKTNLMKLLQRITAAAFLKCLPQKPAVLCGLAALMLGFGSLANAAGNNTYTFTSSGTWVCPPGVTSVTLELWGGGGAGGSAITSSGHCGGGGGGGGAYVQYTSVTVSPGSSYTVTVGGGGTSSGGTSTGGGNSSITIASTTYTANGGAAGVSETASGNYGAGGAGGTAAGSGTPFAGGTGATASSANGGGGGGSSAGTGAAGAAGSGTTGGTPPTAGGAGGAGDTVANGVANGSAGSFPGGGGGGAYGASAQRSGGAGGGGQVIIVGGTTTAFTPGNLAVLSADDAALNNSTFTILELSPTTAGQTFPSNSIAINGTTGGSGGSALRTSGSAGTAAKLADSSDGHLLLFGGFNSTNSSVTANTILTRGVGTLDAFDNFTLQTTYTGISGNQVRDAATVDNNTWYAGDAGGIYTNNDTAPLITSNLVLKSYGNTIYAMQKSQVPVVSTITAGGTVLTPLTGLSAVSDSSAADFCLVSSQNNGTYDTLYYLQQTNATSGGIVKYSLVSGTWTDNGTNADSLGGAGICAATNGNGGVYLYVTTGDGTVAGNNVVRLTDTAGLNATININSANDVTLYTALAGATMKGIAFAPFTYSVTYNGNGNTGGTVPTDNNAYASGATVTVLGNPNGLTLSGYTFGGWSLTQNGTAVSSFTISSNTTVYAVWTQSPVITIVSGSPVTFPAVQTNSSAVMSYVVSGAHLSGNLSVALSGANASSFQISSDGGSTWHSSLTLTASSGTVNNTTISVQFNPLTLTSYSATIQNTDTGASGAPEQDVSVTGTGASVPAVSTQAANPTNATSATLNGTVVANNNAAITDRGFWYGTASGVTESSPYIQADQGGTTVSTYSKSVTGLSANTEYYYRAYAVNSIGNTLDSSGDEKSFWTLANTPTAAPVVSTVPGITTANNTTLNFSFAPGSDGNPGGTLYAIKETGTGKYVQASSGTLVSGADFESASTWSAVTTLSGLNPGTAYTFEAEAENSLNEATAFGPSAMAYTANQPFTAGNLAVLACGTSSETTNLIYELSPSTASQSSPVNTFVVPSTGPSALRQTDAASSGLLSDSGDGSLVLFAGYEDPTGAADETTITNRGVGTLDALGDYVLQASYTNSTGSGDQARSAATVNDTTYYIGDKAGIYVATASVPVGTPAVSANIRPVKAFGGTVYALQQGGGATVVSSVSADGTTLTGLTGLPVDGKAVDFYMVSSQDNGTYDTLYYLDQTNATSGGIYKYSLIGGTWTAESSYQTTFEGVGICAAPFSGGVYLYVTSGAGNTAANTVYRLTDASAQNASINITTGNNVALFTADANHTMKGVSFVPGFVTNYTRAAGITLKIPIAGLTNLANNLDGCTYAFNSASGTSGSGSTLTYDGTYVYYTNSTPVSTNDSFTYTLTATIQTGSPLITGSVASGNTFTVTGLVTIGQTVGQTGQQTPGTLNVVGGSVSLTFYGYPGQPYYIQRTTSLTPPVTWTDISGGPFTASSKGIITATDTPGGGITAAYYRLSTSP
jgi:uncharacterized repeat protein (TIGR02543 family)